MSKLLLGLSSQVQRNIKKDFFRGCPTETFTWSTIEEESNSIDILLSNLGKRGSLGEVLTQ